MLDERFALWQKGTVLKIEIRQDELIAVSVLPRGMISPFSMPSDPVKHSNLNNYPKEFLYEPT